MKVDKLVEDCNKNTDENGIISNVASNDHKKVLFAIHFIISIGIISTYFYFHWYLKKGNIETPIYWTYKWETLNRLILKIEHITFVMI